MFRKSFPNYRQFDQMDCGPTCLQILAKHYGKETSLEEIRQNSYIDRSGVSLAGIKSAAEIIGFETFSVMLSWEDLRSKVPTPCIIHWDDNHFVVLYRIKNQKVFVSDPARGKQTFSVEDFKKHWIPGKTEGVVMILQPTQDFYTNTGETKLNSEFSHLYKYFSSYKNLIWQLLIGLLISSLIQLALPFFTQSIVDYGIENQDFGFIQVILIGQLFFVITRIFIEILRDWILLHISMRINIRMMSDYLSRLIQLPLSFFSRRSLGDLLTRINDNEKIEEFFTNGSLAFVFDIFNIFLFGIVLAYYNLKIFLVFLAGSIIYLLWTFSFMKKKERLDKAYFKVSAQSQSKILQIISNIEDIKINGSQDRRKNEWYEHQLKLFDVSTKTLKTHQFQINGGQLINEIKNVLIVFLSAWSVIQGSLTLGAMLAIQFIIGQLNVPLSKLAEFLLDFQKAELATKRLFEVQREKREGDDIEGQQLFKKSSLHIDDLSFRYGPPGTSYALNNVSLKIPKGKITAIVGHSGSGKSTLVKLLLNFYKPTSGQIKIGKIGLDSIKPNLWREVCGVVLQDGRLFNDTLERNITESASSVKTNHKRLKKAIEYSMLTDVVNELPHQLKTIIGENGTTLSGGEKQRVLIARAIYKNPDYFFLDEATSSLDSINEKHILRSLESFYKNRTVIIIAHRLSTIKNADNIIVLEKGSIKEQGSHEELLLRKGKYLELVQNQLDIVKA